MGKAKGPETGREILFEFVQMGTSVKVMAVDALTGTEVSIVGPATASDYQLKQTALQKLKYVLEKKKK
jgi:hypothetical protein